jgi:hypothetical protein
MNYDFSTWAQPMTRRDFKEYYRAQHLPFYRRYGFAMLAYICLIILGIFVITTVPNWFVGDAQSSTRLTITLVASAFLASIILGVVWWIRIFLRNVRLNKFCEINDLEFREQIKNLCPPGLPFDRDSQSITRPAVMNDNFVIGRYYITQSRDEYRTQIHLPFTFTMARLPRRVPHIVLKNRLSKIVSPTKTGKITKMKLEGNFSDTFTLLCPPDYERDALYIFTPDVMAACLDLAGDAEIELVDDHLFLYTRSGAVFRDPRKLAAAFDAVQQLTARFHKQTKAYRDQKSTGAARVSAAARRLNFKDRTWLRILISVVLGPLMFAIYYLIHFVLLGGN